MNVETVRSLQRALAHRIADLIKENGLGAEFASVADNVDVGVDTESDQDSPAVLIDGLGDLVPGILVVKVERD